MSDPRSQSLDAAVEAAAWQIARTIVKGPDVAENERETLTTARAAIEAALPHLPAAPSGEPQEPSEEAVDAAERAYFAEGHSQRHTAGWETMRGALAAAYAVDRPREPSPELREPQESVSADEVRGIFRDRETVEWDDEVRERPQEPPEGDG